MPRIRLARGLGRRSRWSILGQPGDGPAAARARAPSTGLVARNVSGNGSEGYRSCEVGAFVGVGPAVSERNSWPERRGHRHWRPCEGLLGGHRRCGARDEPPPLRSEHGEYGGLVRGPVRVSGVHRFGRGLSAALLLDGSTGAPGGSSGPTWAYRLRPRANTSTAPHPWAIPAG